MKKYLSLLLVSIFLFGCAPRRTAKRKTYQHYELGGYYGNNNKEEDKKDKLVKSTKEAERKILYSAYLNMVVDIPDTANFYIQKIAKKYNGYSSQIGSSKTIIRVSSDDLDKAIAEISELGRVESINKTSEDVTNQFLDYQIRLENAVKARKKYLELLALSKTVEEALKVEKELERLNETIDLLKGKMNRINHLSDYSTITIYLTERKKPGILGYIGIGIYQSVKWLFVRN